MRKYVITGATGLIGRALIKEITAAGDTAVALVNPESRRADGLLGCVDPAGALEIYPCSADAYADFEVGELRADAFIHLAWAKTSHLDRDDVYSQLKNVEYTLDAVRLAAKMGCRSFVGAGSQAEFGRVSEAISGNTPANPESAYGIAKYTAGKLSATLAKKSGMRHNWVRILSIFGEDDAPTTLISYLVKCFSEGVTPELTKCEQIWDYMYVSDAARAIIAVADRGIDGRVYCIGSGKGRKLSEYVEDIRDAFAPDAKINFGAKEYYPHQPMYLVADISELEADTGFRVKYSFDEGVSLMAAALKNKKG